MARALPFRKIVTLIAVVGAAALLSGCGRTLVFAESSGVNLGIRTNASSDTPIEVNFGLRRAVGSIVPAGGKKKDGTPDGDAVSMFSGFQVNNSLVTTRPIDADLRIDTQFASGEAAVQVASKPKIVAEIVNVRSSTYSTSDSAKQFRAWLLPDGKTLSTNRFNRLQAWLDTRYPTKKVFPGDLLGDSDGDDFEAARVAALRDLKDVAP